MQESVDPELSTPLSPDKYSIHSDRHNILQSLQRAQELQIRAQGITRESINQNFEEKDEDGNIAHENENFNASMVLSVDNRDATEVVSKDSDEKIEYAENDSEENTHSSLQSGSQNESCNEAEKSSHEKEKDEISDVQDEMNLNENEEMQGKRN